MLELKATALAVGSFLNGTIGRALLIGGAVLALAAAVHHSGYASGVKHEQVAEAARLDAARKVVSRHEARADAVTSKAVAQLETAQAKTRTVTRTIIEKVNVYVPAAADARCVVPIGFVRVHDAAALGDPASLSGPSGQPLDTPSGVALSAVLGTVAGNYGAAYEWRDEAVAWRAWYVAQKAAWDKP